MKINLKAISAAAALATCAAATSTAALAKTQVTYVQPFLCESTSDSSEAGFVSAAGKTEVLDIVLTDEGDYAGGLFGGFSAFAAEGSSVTVIVTPTATSSNLSIMLAVAATNSNKTDIFSLAPSSVANKGSYLVYTFSFDRSRVPSTAQVKKLAVYAIQTGSSGGNVYMDSFYLNGTQISKKILKTGTCLSY
jgi:hypothetical protein